jgi:Bacterial Ig-like domain (group 1)
MQLRSLKAMSLPIARGMAALLVAATLVSCGGGGSSNESGPGQPSDVTIASVSVATGDRQTAIAGTELPNALTVRVQNKSGAAISGAVVNFRVLSGNGTLFAGSATTDSNGLARERWTLGVSAAEPQRVEARAVAGDGTALTASFDAFAIAGPAARIEMGSGAGQSAVQTQALPSPISVVVQDSNSNPVAGVAVAFTVNGGGTVFPLSAVSDRNGQARTTWTLGVPLGVQKLTADAVGLPPLEVSANATMAPPGAPQSIVRVAGDMQTVLQHAALPNPLVAWVTDGLGNGVPGVSVTFAPAAGSPYFRSGSAQTSQPLNDAGGYVSWKGYFHTAGTQVVEASVSPLLKVTFQVEVIPSPHRFDGYYGCRFSTRPLVSVSATVTDGVLAGESDSDPGHFFYSTSLAEDTGEFAANFRASLDVRYLLTGEFVVAAEGRASGSGIYTIMSINSPVGTGTWTCERQ